MYRVIQLDLQPVGYSLILDHKNLKNGSREDLFIIKKKKNHHYKTIIGT